jgi:hypothetical protein
LLFIARNQQLRKIIQCPEGRVGIGLASSRVASNKHAASRQLNDCAMAMIVAYPKRYTRNNPKEF